MESYENVGTFARFLLSRWIQAAPLSLAPYNVYTSHMKFSDNEIATQVLDRFLRYARIETTSDRHASRSPTTEGQWTLLRMLKSELQEMGVSDVRLDDNGFLIAGIPGNRPARTTIGLMAHVDTASDVTAENVNPIVCEAYDGKKIELSDGVIVDPESSPDLLRYIGETIITTDGTTLLGADDKAGVAEIMTLTSILMTDQSVPHGNIEIIFTPDEETGHGMDLFPLDAIASTACYTLDGSTEGVIEAECFDAAKLEIVCTGVSFHTGTARGRLVNAISMLMSLLNLVPRSESPEATDGRFGFYAPIEMQGSLERAHCTILIRDFDKSAVDRRCEAVQAIAKAVEAAYPGGAIDVRRENQYENLRQYLDKDPRVVENLLEAIRKTGIEPEERLIRGGTDGSRLAAMGVPTPNLFTGGYDYHSRSEWAALPAMVRAVRVLENLCSLWVET
jgi:tripeptide aminopeptidase